MHETTMAGTMASMRPIARIPVRDGEILSFRPGGRHLMVYDIGRGVAAGDTITLVFHFERGGTQTLGAELQPVGGDIERLISGLLSARPVLALARALRGDDDGTGARHLPALHHGMADRHIGRLGIDRPGPDRSGAAALNVAGLGLYRSPSSPSLWRLAWKWMEIWR